MAGGFLEVLGLDDEWARTYQKHLQFAEDAEETKKILNDADVDSVLNSDSDYPQTDNDTIRERLKIIPSLCRDKRLLRLRTEIAKILEQEETSSDSGVENCKIVPKKRPKFLKSQIKDKGQRRGDRITARRCE